MEMSSWSNLFGRFITAILLGLFSSRAPVFHPKEAADDKGLPGVYGAMRVVHDGKPAPVHESLTIARSAPGVFTLTFSKDGNTMLAFDARLYAITAKGKAPRRYFDMTARPAPANSPERDRIPPGAAHQILPFELEDGRLELQVFDPAALEASAQKSGVAYVWPKRYQPLVITASTAAVRGFFLGAAPEAMTVGTALYLQ